MEYRNYVIDGDFFKSEADVDNFIRTRKLAEYKGLVSVQCSYENNTPEYNTIAKQLKILENYLHDACRVSKEELINCFIQSLVYFE